MNRRTFLLAGAAAIAGASLRAAASEPRLLLSESELARIKDLLAKPGRLDTHAASIRANAEKTLKAGPWSVTYERPAGRGVAAGPNDYYSEGPYWWPDPKNPGGPYIRRDGERNPERFMGNRRPLGEMCEAVLALGQAAFFLGDDRCAERAAMVLNTWFLNSKTLMNPHLEYGQAVLGHNTGRGIGIIDTVSLIHCALGVSLAEASGKLDRAVAGGVREWYARYLKWMTTSHNGLDEKKAGNNHATWWTAQAAAYATFVGDTAARRMAWQHYRTWLVPSQVRPDGSCPREEARTRSLSYSTMNLDGFSVLCRIAHVNGEDLWRYRTPEGIGIEKAFYYLMPFILDPGSWKKQQIAPFDQRATVYLGLAGLGLGSPSLLAAYRKLPRAATPWVQLVDLLVQTAAAESGSHRPGPAGARFPSGRREAAGMMLLDDA